MKEVFISYMREDNEIIDGLCAALSAMGVSYWRDKRDIPPSKQWAISIQKGITEAKFFVACFSETYMDKEDSYMTKELEFAIQQLGKESEQKKKLMPLRLSKNAQVPDLEIAPNTSLRDIQWIDFYGKNYDEGLLKLFEILQPGESFEKANFELFNLKDTSMRIKAIDKLKAYGEQNTEFTLRVIGELTKFIRSRSPWKAGIVNNSIEEDIQHAACALGSIPRKDKNGNLMTIDLHNVDLSYADLQNLNFEKAVLWGSNFNNAVLSRANFRGADLGGCDFTNASLEMTDLEGAFLWWSTPCEPVRPCIFEGSILSRTNFRGTDLSGAIFRNVQGLTKAQIEEAIINENTQLPSNLAT